MKNLYELNHDYLKHILNYEKETGKFYWKIAKSSKTIIGKEAGTLHPNGYIYIRIDGFGFRAHRLAWFYVNKKWPTLEIDHINRIKTDNRIDNLRDVTSKENQNNKSKQETLEKRKYNKRPKFNQEEFLKGQLAFSK